MTAEVDFKIVCNAHAKRNSKIVERFRLIERSQTCDEAFEVAYGRDTFLAMAQKGALRGSCSQDLPSDRQRSMQWCRLCAGSNWRVTVIGPQLLDGDELVPRAEVLGSHSSRPVEGLHERVRYRYPIECWCGINIEMTHKTAEVVLSELADSGRTRVVLSKLAAMLSSSTYRR